ncbi:MAG: acetate--CoA ligase family protein [Bacteroidales bacterium]|nr:acetate--CoA ligase family protein [Bacteroidales bacterium]
MISNQLINPKSIVIVGGSNDIEKPGGKVLKNIIDGNFNGDLYVANPKLDEVQGIKSFINIENLPDVDLAIIAIAAKYTVQTVEFLAKQKNTRGFIILSAGYSEESHEGAELENKIVEIIESVNGSLIGPNCIGLLNTNFNGVFTTPIPKLNPQGIDMVSGSGATAVFIMESALPKGLTFNSVWSVGNSAQLGVEDVIQHLDETFDPETSSKVKLLYIEKIEKPQKLLKHASSLIRKGCRIAAIKAGSSDAGSRAASSHTGALASSDVAVSTLFKKAGIVRCYGREELATVAAIFQQKELKGKNIAVITHAGGPGVMLTDALSNGGLDVPAIIGEKAEELLTKLFPGSSVANPIDFLATGTAEQLGNIIDYCDNHFENIDAMAVIFGSPGLFEIFDVLDVLHEKMQICKKPIYPILPSLKETQREIADFQNKGNQSFPDEVIFGNALTKIFNTSLPAPENIDLPQDIDKQAIRKIIEHSENGYLHPDKVAELLDAAGIARVHEKTVETKSDAVEATKEVGFPLVMKVVGPVHKSDVGGIVLNVKNIETVEKEFDRIMQIPDAVGVLLQPMLSGTEIFAGVKAEEKFGHLVLAGLGGIFIEVLKDVNSALVPVSENEALDMIKNLKAYKIIEGVRGQEGVNIPAFVNTIQRISALVTIAPEIAEMDINPLLGNSEAVTAVDARIRIEK